MSDGSSRIERILERTARVMSGGGLHPAELLSRVQAAYLAGVRQGLAPNRMVVRLHPDDFAMFAPAFGALRDEIAEMLDDESRRARSQHIGALLVEFAEDPAVERSLPIAEATFADTSHPRRAPVSGATVVMQRHSGAALLINGRVRVMLTHTPFTIGRGQGNDLVLPSLAVSRVHARVIVADGEFVIEDLGGRNGIQVDGEQVSAAVLYPGVTVQLGDTALQLVEGR